jgi:putative hydrolase
VQTSFNTAVAARFDQAADLLSQQGANPFRINAYRRGADAVRGLDMDLRRLLEEGGVKALVAVPGIGRGMAAAIREMALSGRWAKLERLRGAADPAAILQTVPGIGPGLAGRLHDELHIDSLEQLECAAHDGRLAAVRGIGERRLRAIRASLEAVLGHPLPRRPAGSGPGVAVLLDVDAEYRRRAAADELAKITPRRFNPERRAWLPVLHTDRDKWHFTALYSNTARAHELGRTGDWVVIYHYDSDDHVEGQHTVVTENRGALAARRVVRGREAECLAHYLKDTATRGRNGA